MFIFSNIEDADKIHTELLEIEKEILTKLELPFRVIDVATGDLGSSAARKFDCEAWIPSSNEYRELTSTSNCTEFQARRLKIRTRVGDKTNYVATLNGTLLAVTRTIVALLENHQQKDGSINIPKALRSYLSNGFKDLGYSDEEIPALVEQNVSEYTSGQGGYANGGRIGYAYGSNDLVEQASGIMGLPQRVNQAGVKELDLRDSGGFIPPVGVKEKADDIPAMLSNNEFVFTAESVRNMGNGDVNKGAQRMYDMMKYLEKGGIV